MLKLHKLPTAKCYGNDKMAMNVYMQLQKRDTSIPGQISIVKFSDYTLISELVNPSLTTAKLPHAEIDAIADTLLDE